MMPYEATVTAMKMKTQYFGYHITNKPYKKLASISFFQDFTEQTSFYSPGRYLSMYFSKNSRLYMNPASMRQEQSVTVKSKFTCEKK